MAQTLPQNLDAERALIGACLLRPAELDATADVMPEDFANAQHRLIWEAMRALRGRGDEVDAMTVSGEMPHNWSENGVSDLAAFLDHASILGAQPAAALVTESSRLRKLIVLCDMTRTRCMEQRDTADEIVADVRAAVVEIEVCGSGTGPAPIGDGIASTLEAIEGRARAPGADGLPTGNQEYDKKIGTMRPGNLIVVAGTPGMGKSAYAQGVADVVACAGYPALMLSYEMPRAEQIERMLSASSKVDAYRIRTGDINYGDWRKISASAAGISRLPMYIETRSLTISQIIGEARRWYVRHANGKHALVVVDYLQLVRTEGKKQNRERDVADISTGLKQLAMTDGMPITVMALSQLNRSVTKEMREPTISDLRESGQIEADADLVIFPWREMVADAEGNRHPSNSSGPCKIIVGKNRSGRTGVIPAHWEAAVMRFSGITESISNDQHWMDGQ